MLSPCEALDLSVDQIKSISKGVDEEGAGISYCSSFSMTKQQVVRYFKKAKVVQGMAFHELDWSACFVGGTIKKGAGLVKWRINATCAGQIEWANGKVQYFYYEPCESL